MKKILFILIVMIFASIFSGISTNNGWIFAYEFELELIDISSITKSSLDFTSLFKITKWTIVILSHIGVIGLLFISNKPYFKKMLFFIPLIYLVSYFLSFNIFVFLLIPFVIFWLIALYIERYIRT